MAAFPLLAAFDFDGVLCDSSREVALVALLTFRELEPAADLPPPPAPAPRSIERHALYRPFMELMPLGNRAEDFGIALAALAQGVAIPSQEAYDRWAATFDPAWLAAFHRRFYARRSALRETRPQLWLDLHKPYATVVQPLHRLALRLPFAIATAKDAASVLRLLEAFGLAALVPPARIADKRTGRSKRAHLTALAAAAEVPLTRIVFVDDKVNHLEDVAGIGVRCLLAGWGYNGDREHRRAHELGFTVAWPETLEREIAG